MAEEKFNYSDQSSNDEEMSKHISVVDHQKDYNEGVWVVSLIHHGDTLGGHAEIVVEGIDESSTLYFKAFHIIPAFYEGEDPSKSYLPQIFNNAKGDANIFVVEVSDPLKEYIRECGRKRSWYCYKENAQKMIDNILEEKKKCDNPASEYKVRFQYAGKSSIWSSSKEERFNCVDWCRAKLEVARIEVKTKPLDYFFKSMPAKHASPINDKVDSLYNEIASKTTGAILLAGDVVTCSVDYVKKLVGM